MHGAYLSQNYIYCRVNCNTSLRYNKYNYFENDFKVCVRYDANHPCVSGGVYSHVNTRLEVALHFVSIVMWIGTRTFNSPNVKNVEKSFLIDVAEGWLLLDIG